jgi:hypothetical protein
MNATQTSAEDPFGGINPAAHQPAAHGLSRGDFDRHRGLIETLAQSEGARDGKAVASEGWGGGSISGSEGWDKASPMDAAVTAEGYGG